MACVCERCGKKFDTKTHGQSMGILLENLTPAEVARVMEEEFGATGKKWPAPCDDCAREVVNTK